MKSATCRSSRRRVCCGCCSRANTPPSAAVSRIETDVRIVAASNKDRCAAILIQLGLFRGRTCFSASTWCRCGCRRYANRSRGYRPDPAFLFARRKGRAAAEEARRAGTGGVKQHRWPGNVRELENVRARARGTVSAGRDHGLGDRRRAHAARHRLRRQRLLSHRQSRRRRRGLSVRHILPVSPTACRRRASRIASCAKSKFHC